MKQFIIFGLAALILVFSSCSAGEAAVSASVAAVSEPVQQTAREEVPGIPSGSGNPAEKVLTDRETIEEYFSRQYHAYTSFSEAEISGLLDLNQTENQNLLVWLETLNQRRRLLRENDLCYVETSAFPYTIEWETEPEDDRMNFWRERMGEEDYDAVYHFRIRGEEGQAYPPTFAVNAQHTIFLKKEDGTWKILRHYYPGAVRNFRFSGELTLPSEAEMLAELRQEFAEGTVSQASGNYQPQKAAGYAMKHIAQPNPEFYHIGDWRGNCQNFVSQAVSAGFGTDEDPFPMSSEWFGGSGGGSPAWENVDYFWNYAVSQRGIRGEILSGVLAMEPGDLLQIRSTGDRDPEDFNHGLILVNQEKLMFAQNSPGCYVYYSDLVNVQTRIFRPVSFAG